VRVLPTLDLCLVTGLIVRAVVIVLCHKFFPF
jgi:hypothetical protein